MIELELTFLGTGGCRICMLKQRRQTGGFILRDKSFMMSVDPGPGALVYGIKKGLDLSKLNAIFVSHPHLDHEGDAEAMIEAMTGGCMVKKGLLISNKDYLSREPKFGSISDYHRKAVERELIVNDGDSHVFEENLKIEFIELQHKNVETTGFKLSRGGKTFSYIPDTSMFEGIKEKYSGSDYIVISCPRTHRIEWKGHLGLKDVAELVGTIEPEKVYLNHLGVTFLDNIEEEKDWLKEKGIFDRVIIPDDNQTFHINI